MTKDLCNSIARKLYRRSIYVLNKMFTLQMAATYNVCLTNLNVHMKSIFFTLYPPLEANLSQSKIKNWYSTLPSKVIQEKQMQK
jgi:hypothetical protein